MLSNLLPNDGDDNESLPDLNSAIKDLPPLNVSSFPSIIASTLVSDPPPSSAVHVKKPKEKLTTVLKESERLLRSTNVTKNFNLPEKTAGPKKLDNFVKSLKEQTFQKSVMNSSPNPKSELQQLISPEILSRRPKLSGNNDPDDNLQIILTEESIRENLKSARSMRKAIAPKSKVSSITKLNKVLDEKIKTQHLRTVEEKRQAQKMENIEEQFDNDEDEFGVEDHELEEIITDDDPYEEEIENEGLHPKFRNIVSLSDDDNVIKDENQMRRHIISDDSDGGDDTNEDEDDIGGLKDLIISNKPSPKKPDLQITQFLSGEFQNEKIHLKEEEEKGTSTLTMLKKNEKIVVNREEYTFFEEEAEDEDSQVSADEIDEEAIAKELKDSAFLADTDSESHDEGTQLALHRDLIREHEEEEMEIFMNRFVPEEVLRETGIYGKLKEKYIKVFDPTENPKGDLKESKFGQIKGLQAESVKSHPDFLKLIEQDRVGSDSEHFTEEFESSEDDIDREQEATGPIEGEYFNEHAEREGIFTEMDTLLATTINVTYNTIQSVKRTTFQVTDENLRMRLQPKEEASTVETTKKPKTTFETISSRPVLPKPKSKK